MFKKTLSLTVVFCFFLTTLGPLPKAQADSVLGLPAPGTMVNLSPAYEPVIIKGLTVHKDNPFLFDFIVDVGQDKMSGEPLKKEGEKLIKYFLASLAIPDKDVWVNLSPYEKSRMIPEVLGQTDMGRDLLEQDYILKQITASLIYPEKQLGKTFWDKVYSKAQQMYGTTQVPVNTFNKVWIMADRAEVFEHNQTAFVVDSHLKVMLEEDYLALQKHADIGVTPTKATVNNLGSQMVRTIILPELEKEVNTGKNFANLRQIFNSIILSSWYKKNLKEALLNQVYADKAKVKGIDLNDPTVKQQIYEQYLKAYKKGVFNYIKEDVNAAGAMIPRKYFSGGMDEGMAAKPKTTTDTAMLTRAMRGGISDRLMNLLAGFLSSDVKINPATIKFNDGLTVTSGQMTELIDRLKRHIYHPDAPTLLKIQSENLINIKPDEDIVAIDASYPEGLMRRINVRDSYTIKNELAAGSREAGFEIKDQRYEHKKQGQTLWTEQIWTIKHDQVDAFKNWLDDLKREILGLRYEDTFVPRNIRAIITPASIEFKFLRKERISVERLELLIDHTQWHIDYYKLHSSSNIPKGRFIVQRFDSKPDPFYYMLAHIMEQKGWQGKVERMSYGYQLTIAGNDVNNLVQLLKRLKQSIQSAHMGPTTFDAAMLANRVPNPFKEVVQLKGGLPEFRKLIARSGIEQVFCPLKLYDFKNGNSPTALVTSVLKMKDAGKGIVYIAEDGSVWFVSAEMYSPAFKDDNKDIPKKTVEELYVDAAMTTSAIEKAVRNLPKGKGYWKKIASGGWEKTDKGVETAPEKWQLIWDRLNLRPTVTIEIYRGVDQKVSGWIIEASREREGNPFYAAWLGGILSIRSENQPTSKIGNVDKDPLVRLDFSDVKKKKVALIHLIFKNELYKKLQKAGLQYVMWEYRPSMLRNGFSLSGGIPLAQQTSLIINIADEAFWKKEGPGVRKADASPKNKTNPDAAMRAKAGDKAGLKSVEVYKEDDDRHNLGYGGQFTGGSFGELRFFDSSKNWTIEADVTPFFIPTFLREAPRSGYLLVLLDPSITNKPLKPEIFIETKQENKELITAILRELGNQQVKSEAEEILRNSTSKEEGEKKLGDFLIVKIKEIAQSLADAAMQADKVAVANAVKQPWEQGGIDLNTSNGMQWKVSKDGQGVEMNIDPAMIERVRREGIDSLSPVIFRITPVTSIWPLVGLQAPAQAEHLAGV